MMRSPESARPAGRSRQMGTPTTDSGTTLSIGTLGVAIRYLLPERRRLVVLLFAGAMYAVSQSLRVASSEFCATTSEPAINDSRINPSITLITHLHSPCITNAAQ